MFLSLKEHGHDKSTQRFYVIHEFGHAFGLLHEHQRTDFWSVTKSLLDEKKMKIGYGMSDEGFKRDMEAIQKDTSTDDKYDPDSVMHYW